MRGHDQRFTDRTRGLVEARLAGQADRDQRVIDAPHRAEQTDERSGRAGGRQHGEAVLQAAADAVDRAIQGNGDPLVQRDLVGEAAFVMLGGAQTVFGDHLEGVVLALELRDAVTQIAGGPEALLDFLVGHAHAALIPQLRQDHVPGRERHDHQDDQHARADVVALLARRLPGQMGFQRCSVFGAMERCPLLLKL